MNFRGKCRGDGRIVDDQRAIRDGGYRGTTIGAGRAKDQRTLVDDGAGRSSTVAVIAGQGQRAAAGLHQTEACRTRNHTGNRGGVVRVNEQLAAAGSEIAACDHAGRTVEEQTTGGDRQRVGRRNGDGRHSADTQGIDGEIGEAGGRVGSNRDVVRRLSKGIGQGVHGIERVVQRSQSTYPALTFISARRNVAGKISAIDRGPAANQVLGQYRSRRVDLGQDDLGVAQTSLPEVRASEIDRGTNSAAQEVADGQDRSARVTGCRSDGVQTAGSDAALKSDSAERFRGSQARCARQQQRAALQCDAHRVLHAIWQRCARAVDVRQVAVVDAERAEIVAHRGRGGQGGVVTQLQGAATDHSGTTIGLGCGKQRYIVAGTGEGQPSAAEHTTKVAATSGGQDSRSSAGHSAACARIDVVVGERSDGLILAVQIERASIERQRNRSHRCRRREHRQRIGCATAESHRSIIDHQGADEILR